jgi:hypothetical protein
MANRMAELFCAAVTSVSEGCRLHDDTSPLALRTVRPSLLDMRFRGDPWIIDRRDGTFALCLGNYDVAWVHGLPVDLPSLNRLLDGARHRRPRRPAAQGCQVR